MVVDTDIIHLCTFQKDSFQSGVCPPPEEVHHIMKLTSL